MKLALKKLPLALGAAALLLTVGCDSIRDYSVNSYQGVMPIEDFRPTGSAPPMAMTSATPAPAADKPVDSSK